MKYQGALFALPERPGDIAVMDNLPAHMNSAVRNAFYIRRCQYNTVILPTHRMEYLGRVYIFVRSS